MRGRAGDQKTEWLPRTRPTAGETKRQPRVDETREEAEKRLLEAEALKTEFEAEKISAEIAQKPLKAKKLEAQIAREEAEARAIDCGTLGAQAHLIVFLLMVILVLALALVNPVMLTKLAAGGLFVALLGVLGRRLGNGP